ncbi:MAG: hypothetical protein JW864_04355 [Spirochaetes bacterium]|nr:hypothetical protein [Spirochaetota bacterium]
MKKIIFFFLIFSVFFSVYVYSNTEKKNISVTEENKSFWDLLLSEKSVKNKNLLYASYIAYKDRLNDLSIETFRECIMTNNSNKMVMGIAEYYIGKNLFFIGKYEEAITQFTIVNNYDLAKYNYLKFAALLNTAVSYYHLGDDQKFRENLQKVINDDTTGTYRKKALDILSAVQ